MKENIIMEIEKEKLDNINNILSHSYIDLNMLIQMVFNRTIQENSINWITHNGQSKNMSTNKSSMTGYDVLKNEVKSFVNTNHITKNIACRMFEDNGNVINRTCTFASKNKTAYNYWANPNFDVLKQDWSLILNDNINKEIYLFNIPKNTFIDRNFVPRCDIAEKMDIQIMYNDPTFTDNRSYVSFKRYLVDSIKY